MLLRGNPSWQKGVSGNPTGRPKIPKDVRELARGYTKQAIERAAKVKVRPVRKVIADARKSLALPDIKAPGLEDYAAQITQHIEELYQDALRTIEIAALIAKREREDEDDEDILLLMA